MKRITMIALAALVLCLAAFPAASRAEGPARKALARLDGFIADFNRCAASGITGHVLSSNSAEISGMGDSALFKQIFNGCEILSLTLTRDMSEVTQVNCTLATYVRDSSLYTGDFTDLLMEALYACGMETEAFNAFLSGMEFDKDGGTTTAVVGELEISWIHTKLIGMSFKIVRAA